METDNVAWEDSVIECVKFALDVTRGDAQAIVEAHGGIVQEGWGLGLTPEETAKRITDLS